MDGTDRVQGIFSKSIIIGEIELRTQVERKPLVASQYYVEISLGDVSRSTEPTKEVDGRTSWNQIFNFDGEDNSLLLVLVFQSHLIGGDAIVGSLVDTVRGALEKLKDGVLEGSLRRRTSPGVNHLQIAIKFALAVQPRGDLDAEERQTVDAARRVPTASTVGPIGRTVGLLNSVRVAIRRSPSSEGHTFQNTWGVLLHRLRLFDNITAGIAQIHPYTSLAWSVISAANQVLVERKYCNDAIIRLAGTMRDAFAFVQDKELERVIDEHVKTITLLVQQVTECGYFIMEYAKQEFFWSQTAAYTSTQIDGIVTHFQDKLIELQRAFLERAEVQTGLTVVRLMNPTEPSEDSMDLDDIPYASEAKFDRGRGCLPGTRKTLLREIHDVLNSLDENGPRVYLLTGVAGSGKSTVAHTIARLYDEQERLGSSYFFNSTNVAHFNPKDAFITIARDLSDRDPQYKSALWQVVKASTTVRTSQLPMEQVEELIIKPSQNLHRVGPLVIVIDGLDESGSEATRGEFLRAISEKIAKNELPTRLRFLITARPESDILTALSNGSRIARKDMGDIPKRDADGDIERFIHHSLDPYIELASLGSHRIWCRPLVRRSQGLFLSAFIACNYIHGNGVVDLHERLETLVKTDKAGDAHPLDRLYRMILEQQFPSDVTRRQFQEVMTVVLALDEPLPLAILSTLFFGCTSVGDVIKPLESLLDGVTDKEKPIRVLHTSFSDFLLQESRSLEFHVKILPRDSLRIGRAMMACMRSMLRFNICELKDARIRNAAIPDLPTRVNKAIPPHLSYSCRHWMNQLQYAERTPELLTEVTLFFKQMFPYWIEVISLLSIIPSAIKTCRILRKWALGEEIATLALETVQFLQAFDPVLRESTPHLYLSALPQIPSGSPLSELCASHFKKHVSITLGQSVHWPKQDLTLQGHTSGVNAIAYSPDSIHVASGSEDNTIRVWDTVIGQCVTGPLHGHTDPITCITYAIDGNHIISGSSDKTIRIWNSSTGHPVAGPFQGHTDTVTSLTTSPDGNYIASGSWDRTIRIWNTRTGQCVRGPFQGHTDSITSVAYSSDGVHIASGSWDNSIRVWSVSTGQCVAGPFQGHTDSITSIAYSPDGTTIASGSKDCSVRIWNATTGQPAMEPLEGHEDTVTCVAYSPDGTHVVSSSWDETIILWNAKTGAAIEDLFGRHEGHVTSVAYSPDGSYILSGSWDNTVKIWSAHAGQQSFQGHTEAVLSIAYSPDGNSIASSSRDRTIRVWNASTGQPIAGPFEGHIDSVYSIAYSPDGMQIVSGSHDETVRVWDASTGQLMVDPFKGHTGSVRTVAYSPDGIHIVSGSKDETVRVWDANTGQCVAGPFRGHSDLVRSVAYSPDGLYIASGSWDHTIRIWNASTGQCEVGPFEGHTHQVISVAYFPDGNHLTSGSSDNSIKIWNASTGQYVMDPLEGHEDLVYSIAYSPDGTHIVTGSADKTIRIWSATTGQCVAGPFQGHSDEVKSVCYSPDGNHIVTGSDDSTIKVWKTQELVSMGNFNVKDGWIQSSSGSCFGWVAPWNSKSFHLPVFSLLITPYQVQQVNIDSSMFGEAWTSFWN